LAQGSDGTLPASDQYNTSAWRLQPFVIRFAHSENRLNK
jgi:hypothetical protein